MANSDNLRPAPTSAYKVASVSVSPSTATIALSGTQQLTPTAKDSTGATVAGVNFKYEAMNPAIATVSASGLVTAAAGFVPPHNTSGSKTTPKVLGGVAHFYVYVKRDDGSLTDIKTTATVTVTGV
jgi:hypothetical protein